MFNAYHMLYIFILVLGVGYATLRNTSLKVGIRRYKVSVIPLVIACIALVLFSGLVGDITTDHSQYIAAFNRIKEMPFSEFFTLDYKISSVEKGYGLILWLVGKMTGESVWFFLVSAALVVAPVVWLSKKTKDPFLFLIIFLGIGYYFASFNVVRQAIAASLFIFTLRYLQKGELIKYIITVIIISMFQISALFMIPFYYLLRQEKNYKTLLRNIAIVLVVSLFIYQLMSMFDNLFFHSKYFTSGRIESVQDIKKIVVPIAAFFVCQFFLNSSKNLDSFDTAYYNLDDGSSKRSVHMLNILNNASVYWIVFWGLTLRFSYFERMTYFFCPIVLFGITEGISKYRKSKEIVIIKLILILLVTLYYFVFGQYLDVYKLFYE